MDLAFRPHRLVVLTLPPSPARLSRQCSSSQACRQQRTLQQFQQFQQQ